MAEYFTLTTLIANSPLSNALDVPFSTSSVSAAMALAVSQIDFALSNASIPSDVIN